VSDAFVAGGELEVRRLTPVTRALRPEVLAKIARR